MLPVVCSYAGAPLRAQPASMQTRCAGVIGLGRSPFRAHWRSAPVQKSTRRQLYSGLPGAQLRNDLEPSTSCQTTDGGSTNHAPEQQGVAQQVVHTTPEHAVQPEAASSSAAAAAPAADSEAERKRLWMAAIKPPMYSVGFIPVLVASAVVYAQFGQLAGLRCAGFVLASILVIAWLNLSNDAFDAKTGVDKTKRESVVNLTGNRTLVLVLANVLLVAGVSLLATLISTIADARPALMLAFSIACGYVYQGPPFRFSYKGLGEPLCFFAFGPSATSAFYLSMLPAAAAGAAAAASTAAITPLVWTVALCVGITTTIILFCSHFHQIEGDTAAGKRSPLVRLGTERAVPILKAATLLPYAALAAVTVAQASGLAPWLGIPYTLLPATLLSVPAAAAMLSFADANHRVPAQIAPLKIYATKLHMAFGMSLVLGLVASRWV